MHTVKKLIIVSGGTKGIGKAMLECFANEAFQLVTCSRNSKNLDNLRSHFSLTFPKIKLHAYQADLSKKEECLGFSNYIKKLNAPIEVLVNNAGLFIPGEAHTEPEGSLEKMIEVNLYSAYYLTRMLVSSMKKNQHGHIFNVCSTASIMAYLNGGSYCISKFALLGFSKVLREELKKDKIRVTSILPGATYTSSWEGVDVPEERLMKPSDIADAVYAAYKLSQHSVIEEILMRPQLGDL